MKKMEGRDIDWKCIEMIVTAIKVINKESLAIIRFNTKSLTLRAALRERKSEIDLHRTKWTKDLHRLTDKNPIWIAEEEAQQTLNELAAMGRRDKKKIDDAIKFNFIDWVEHRLNRHKKELEAKDNAGTTRRGNTYNPRDHETTIREAKFIAHIIATREARIVVGGTSKNLSTNLREHRDAQG